MIRMLSAILCAVLICTSVQAEVPSPFRFTRSKQLDRGTFLTPRFASAIALVVVYGEGRNVEAMARAATKLAPLQPGTCVFVQKDAIVAGQVWLMVNNAAFTDASEEIRLRAVGSHFRMGDEDGKSRVAFRDNTDVSIKFLTNPDITSETPDMRPVFYVGRQADAADLIRVNVTWGTHENETSDNFVLIFNNKVVDDGLVPECKRTPVFTGFFNF